MRDTNTLIAIALVLLAAALIVASAQQIRYSPAGTLGAQSPTGSAATLDQCRNGGVGATPVPCNPTTKNPLGWQNGNAQGQQAHWREGDSISYRVIITGLTPGSTNTLLFNWSTIHGSHHAIDYITSYDRTETTSPTPSQFFANNNNPCSDALPTSDCVPASPASVFPIPSPLTNGVLTNCGGSSGTFVAANLVPAGPLMEIKAYGDPGTTITGGVYQSIQVPSGTGQCSTGFLVTFTTPSSGPTGGTTVVLAWGGHIASQADWGVGNSASFISGSPYHMFLDSLNGASTGAQDRALATSAIFFTPSISTTVIDDATGLPIVSPISVGDTVHDTATLTGASPTAGGTVTYRFWSGANQCPSSSGFTTQVVTVTNGVIPASASTAPLAAGTYSYNATYSGDIGTSGGQNFGANSACEPFTVGKAPSTTATVVFDAATNLPWSGTEQTGASAYDTATVTGTAGFTPTGTVTYTFYTNNACSGTGSSAGTVTLSGGLVPKSNTEGPLAAGLYSFKASYSGDANYNPSVSPCEPFTVAKAPSTTATVVFDAATNTPWSGSEKTGASAYDTATVSGQQDSIVPTGTVSYVFFMNNACSGSGSSAGTVTLDASGNVPNSNTEGPLAAGSYSFQATYSGDSNYAGSVSPCEPFSVAKAPSSTATVVFDAATNLPWAGTEQTGASAYDTATVSGQQDSIVPTGTVSYVFFMNIGCSGSGSSAGTVTLTASGSVPNSNTEGPLAAGDYSFQATYSGDSNYAGSVSPCEPFSVAKAPSTTATVVFDAATNAPWSGTEQTGASAYDTASVSVGGGFVATGTVSYVFFMNNACSGTSGGAGVVTLDALGNVPNSNTEGPLAAGDYSFQATYSGDSNYAGSVSPCEPFSVAKAPSSTATVVFDAATNLPWSGTEQTGSSAYDTATVTGAPFTPTGTVTYTFFTSIDCSGSGSSAGTVTLTASGSVPNSNTEGPLAAGSYSFQASYSGDSNYNPSVSPCEPFTVAKFPPSAMTTTVFDASTNVAWSGTEVTGASAYDTATVTGTAGFTPTGTVAYTFFMNNACTGTGSSAGTVTLDASGNVPNSNTEGPLAAGSYAFQASYSGDSNYLPSVSQCEPFSVAPGPSSTATVVFDAGTNAPWSGTEVTGASAYDTATVSVSGGFTATGTVSYVFFMNIGCSGSGASAGTVTLDASGNVPNSNTEGPLAAGDYSFQASYSGDSNYNPSVSPCEPFSVLKAPSTTATVVFDAATNAPWSGTEQTGASAYDTATVSVSGGFTATGTVSYVFFMNNACTGSGASAGTVTLDASGNVPNSNTEGPLPAGSYSFQATYSGDSNYAGSISPCEPFSVAKAPSLTATIVFDAATNTAWSGTEQVGASAYDTSSVTASPFTPTGTVTYTFFTNSACSGSGSSAGTVTLDASGNVPNSNTEGPLAAGAYAFQASYSGDSNYNPSVSPCEPFTLATAPSSTATVVFDAATNLPWAGTEQTGASAYDTATVTGISGFTPTGTVTYTFFTNNACSGSGSSAGTVTLDASGNVPNSNTEGPLAAGDYSFQASYSGDSNYNPSVSPCEPFSVAQAPSSTLTTLHNAADNSVIALGSNVATGISVYDTAAVSGQVGSIAMTGTITYAFFTNGACSGTPAQTFAPVSLGTQSPTVGPLGTGSYAFQATYSGDSNYAGSVSPCEPFNIVIPSGVTDTQFCPLTNGFRLIYIQDSVSTYTLTASNPGQFYSNVFASLSTPGSLSVSVVIPYPFVTQGAVPIQVFYNQPLPTCGSTVPSSNVNGEFTISPTSITLSSYGASPVVGVTTVTVTFTSTGTLPAGLYWFAIHLNYGLKGFDYSKGSQSCPVATAVTGPSVTIGCPQAYGFSNSITGGTPVTSNNTFNKDPGIAGVVTDSLGTPVAGAKVTVTGGGFTATVTTDANGFYSVSFKGSGKTVTFTVTATYKGYTASATATTKLNSFTIVNLSFAGLVLL